MRSLVAFAAVLALAVPASASAATPYAVKTAVVDRLMVSLSQYEMSYEGGRVSCDRTSLRRYECDITFTTVAYADVEELDLVSGETAECETTAVVRRRNSSGTTFVGPRTVGRYMAKIDAPDCQGDGGGEDDGDYSDPESW